MSERRARLIEAIEAGIQRVPELAAALDVSPSTVRRDLTDLERDGRVLRTHGGAVPASAAERSWEDKRSRHAPAKRAIAARAAELAAPHRSVLLGAGSTSTLIAERLRGRTGLTVVTNGLGALDALREDPEVELVLLGGLVRPRTGAVVGEAAREALRRMTVDIAFVGADGFEPDRGVNAAGADLAALKEAKFRCARHVVVVADSSKVGGSPGGASAPFDHWAPIPVPYTLITDDALPEDRRAAVRSDPRCTLVTVPADGGTVRAGSGGTEG
ncbi:DeoR/GlpR family DNA-binding transcription regulator [Allonocardiopsis opalescens]|uniref:Lactose phosphotransferase system repressor n=1 Tax=Allonocardiopsis opalescens TaxID=1144618 RepID=A0A2T0PVZ3_9ACTN|nr:DeoR/GlpR family DNA-binding transcription regulator [Allonocardiopsis opalescens]PRX95702.1 DeoR family transcriptional regulator [Allonocardiopsis opalescens]